MLPYAQPFAKRSGFPPPSGVRSGREQAEAEVAGEAEGVAIFAARGI